MLYSMRRLCRHLQSLIRSPEARRGGDCSHECYLGLDTEPDVLAALKGTLKAKAAISSGQPSPRSHTRACSNPRHARQLGRGLLALTHPVTNSKHTTFLGFSPRCMRVRKGRVREQTSHCVRWPGILGGGITTKSGIQRLLSSSGEVR